MQLQLVKDAESTAFPMTGVLLMLLTAVGKRSLAALAAERAPAGHGVGRGNSHAQDPASMWKPFENLLGGPACRGAFLYCADFKYSEIRAFTDSPISPNSRS